ncbi:MAG TPA: NAD(P)/FAD-dependent oxidoreductase [Xanthobacteraceae bacterium]|jgi:monoamine oxidase
MSSLSRRSFLAASAAVAAGPSFVATGAPGEVDIAIVGAGAAGIAAARRIAAAGRRFALIEASDRIGGRCITDTRTFGVPFDRGAHWIHMPDINPVARLASQTGLDIYPAPPGQKMRIVRRYAREGEMEEFLAAQVHANRAIADAARGRTDVSCAAALPKDLSDWRSTIEFVLGPFGCAKDLAAVSAMDFARSAERDVDAFCRQGFGALLAKLGGGLPAELSTPVTRIELWGRGANIETERGRIAARGVIVTASTGVLAADKIRFEPELPRRQLEAVNSLSLGSYDRVMLELPGNPLGLDRDDLVFEKSDGMRTAAMLANVSGSSLVMVDIGGKFGRDLAAQGADAMTAFALEWLTGLYGTDLRKAVKRTAATRWNDEPWALGAFSAAAPGGQPARRILMEPVRDRLWFAGEAVHETLWGTVGGAWESGERAADAALKRLGFVAEPRTPAPQRPSPRRRR